MEHLFVVRDVKLHAPGGGKQPVLRFDLVELQEERVDSPELLRLRGVRYFAGQLWPAQRYFKGAYFDHWVLSPLVEAAALAALRDDPAWTAYHRLLVGQGG